MSHIHTLRITFKYILYPTKLPFRKHPTSSHSSHKMRSTSFLFLVLLTLTIILQVSLGNQFASSGSGTMSADTKTSWPELVNVSGESAKKLIEEANPNLKVQIVPENSMVTMDYRMDRVRIFVDANGMVSKPPRIG